MCALCDIIIAFVLLQGIRFIHNSALRYHGNLKWQNCVIDSRWVLKVTDFGLPNIYEASKCSPECDDLGNVCFSIFLRHYCIKSSVVTL